jgi:hypothetical protein
MITCDTIQPRLTAYLDGELADEDGSEVRGHLRECAACRQVARDEAVLRDGLRALPPVDPPPQLWAGIAAQLAAAEVADAHKPRWRRALARLSPARWASWVPSLPQLAAGSALAAAAVAVLYLRSHHADEPRLAVAPRIEAPVKLRPQVAPPPPPLLRTAPSTSDVTADLADEPARVTASYTQAVDELVKLADDARAGWSDDRKATFDHRLAQLRADIARASGPRGQQRAARVLIRYLQGAIVRDDVMLASGGTR